MANIPGDAVRLEGGLFVAIASGDQQLAQAKMLTF